VAAKSKLLLRRKQQLVEDTIWNAAIDLFGKKGFDKTTVDDIAAAAGVSQRTFFRYFSSKSDLMGQGVLTYGERLRAAIKASPKSTGGFDLMQRAVLEIAAELASFPRTREVIAIAMKYPAAREAQLSRMGEVEDRVAEAFYARMRKNRENRLNAQLLAGLTLTVLDVTVRTWFAHGNQNVVRVAAQVMTRLTQFTAGSDVRP
jgi:AcrR family transcriptional regulator